MSDLQTQFDKLLEEQATLRAQFQTKAQELFKQTTKHFFDKNPAITGIIWTQYTPYFNDGETCEFGVNEPSFTNAKDLSGVSSYGEYEGSDEETEWSESSWFFDSDSKHAKEWRAKMDLTGVDIQSITKFSTVIQSSEMEGVMEAMFGNHVRVVATRDGFDVEEYNHD
jgi:hypothetical protein